MKLGGDIQYSIDTPDRLTETMKKEQVLIDDQKCTVPPESEKSVITKANSSLLNN